MLATATLAVAMQLTPIRHQLAQDAAFVALCERDRQQSGAVQCLLELFQVLENESIIVLHPESGQGYSIIINGIGKNFELHTLLADAVLGDPAMGRIPGERPDPRVVAAAKDGPFPRYGEDDYDDFPSATSTLNL
jgi:hypothetical protein